MIRVKCFLAVADEYVGEEMPDDRLTRETYSSDRLHVWGSECSLNWYIWLTQKIKIVKTPHVTFQIEVELLDIVGELRAVDLSDDEGRSGRWKRRTRR